MQVADVQDAEAFQGRGQIIHRDGFLPQVHPAVVDMIQNQRQRQHRNDQKQRQRQGRMLSFFIGEQGIFGVSHTQLLSQWNFIIYEKPLSRNA